MDLFLDANILFAAAKSREGRCSALFGAAEGSGHALVTSPHAIEEARRNLAARYPATLGRLQDELLPGIRIAPEAPAPLTAWALGEGLPPEDAPILAAAVHAGAGALATGDRRHFGPLFGRSPGGVEVLGLRDALDRLLGSGD